MNNKENIPDKQSIDTKKTTKEKFNLFKRKEITSRSKGATRTKIFRVINKIYLSIIIIASVILIVIGVRLIDKYNETLTWKRLDPSITMANQSLDTLYDDNEISKENKIKFKKLYDSMITEDGLLTENATKSNIKTLEQYLNKIDLESSNINYKQLYGEIVLKYSLEKKYNNLFSSIENSELKKEVTPLTLVKLNNETFDDLKLLYSYNPNDKFVQRYIENENKINNDVEIFNELVNSFKDTIVMNGDKISYKEGYHDFYLNQFDEILNKLSYKWESTDYMKKIVILLTPINEQVIKEYNAYFEYENDQDEKNQAYQQWGWERQAFFNEVETIRQQALYEKEQRMIEEQRLQQLQKRKTEVIKLINEFQYLEKTERSKYISQIEAAYNIDSVNYYYEQAQMQEIHERMKAQSTDSSSSTTPSSTTSSSESTSSTTSSETTSSPETSSSSETGIEEPTSSSSSS